MINPALAIKLIFIFAWINLFGLILVLLSCRCIINLPLKVRESKLYTKFYKYHCFYWWIFIISVLMHAILAINTYR